MGQLQNNLDLLMNHYQQDLEIYRQILLETEKTETRWSEKTQHSESSPLSVGVPTGLPRKPQPGGVSQADGAYRSKNAGYSGKARGNNRDTASHLAEKTDTTDIRNSTGSNAHVDDTPEITNNILDNGTTGAAVPAADSAAVQAADQAIREIETLIAWRQEKLNEIDRRRPEAESIKQAIRAELGSVTLDTAVIQRIHPQIAERWNSIQAEVKEKAAQVKVSNEKLAKGLKMEMEYLKLEMHRMQGLQKSRQAYAAPQAMREARFIDKNR